MKTKYTYGTRKGSPLGNHTRNSTNPNLRWVGLDSAGFISMQRDASKLRNAEPLVCKSPAFNGKRLCFLGDDSERWIEKA